eukprot:PhM_4_TR12529/c0_g1_i1/m.100957/K00762/pyrE; orotate phosphoribosyltransferase
MSAAISAELIAFAKQSFRFGGIDALISANSTVKGLHSLVQEAIVRNVRMGPFTTTAGIELPYLLNASTNLMDKRAAASIVQLYGLVLPEVAKAAGIGADEPFVVLGMETAGGMIAAQLAVAAPVTLPNADYIYMRKKKKESGTGQQLEATSQYTSRTSESPALKAIWVDDANSTGSSLLEGVATLKADYNIDVVAALYLVDRSIDRQSLPDERQKLARQDVKDKLLITAIYDLAEIDAAVSTKK